MKGENKRYRLHEILVTCGVSYRLLAQEAGIARTVLYEIVRWQRFPKRQNRATVIANIENALRRQGIAAETIQTCWELVPVTTTSPLKKTGLAHVLKGGAQVIPQEILRELGLNKDPFTNELESIADVFATPQHNHALSKMLDAAKNCKFIGLWGKVGSGKTVLKTLFEERLGMEKNYLISEPFINQKNRLKPSSLADAMIQDFLFLRGGTGTNGQLTAPQNLEAKNRWLKRIMREKSRDGKKLILMIDEAHDLTLDTLKALKRFHELQDGFRKQLAIILLGQEELYHKMGDPRIREVAARIDLVQLQPIPRQTQKYLEYKITRAGGELERVLTSDAIKTITRLLPQANPLEINVLASSAIITAWRSGSMPATGEAVELAYKEIGT